jgi:Cu2+-exporting ATPase/Cu+-exporting ATPase
LTAFQKALLVQKNSPSVFIGDGENDSLSMTKATVSIAVGGAVGSALKSCDVLFVDGKVEKIFDLLKLSQKARRLMIQNITLSFTYNFVGGVLALMGFVSPMVAAALMPLSSGLILLSTVIGGRE